MARSKSTTATAPETVEAAPEQQAEQITLVGRLVADPVLRHTKTSGKAVSNIRIAVNEPDQEPTFHNVVVWGRTAEVVCQYKRKGHTVEITGRPQERSYEAADGTERQVSEIVAWRVQFSAVSRPSPPPRRRWRDGDDAIRYISVLVGPTCPTCESDDCCWGAPLGALQRGHCEDCGTEYRCYAAPDEIEGQCQSCGSQLPDGQDIQDAPFCEDCELSDCVFCGTSVHRFELSENLACRVCETGEVAA